MIVHITRFRFANKNNNKGKNCHNLYKTKGAMKKNYEILDIVHTRKGVNGGEA